MIIEGTVDGKAVVFRTDGKKHEFAYVPTEAERVETDSNGLVGFLNRQDGRTLYLEDMTWFPVTPATVAVRIEARSPGRFFPGDGLGRLGR